MGMQASKRLVDFPGISSQPLDAMVRGFETSQILFTAMEYHLFSLLKEPKTAGQISNQVEIDRQLAEKFLNSLVAFGLLSKTGAHYANTRLAETFLVKGSKFYQGDLLKLQAGISEQWLKLGQALKHGDVVGREQDVETCYRDFILAHAEAAIRGDLQRAVSAIASLPEFQNATRLLDLGGGHGLYAIAFAELNQSLDAFVFDVPHVSVIAREFIKEYGMQERVRIVPGDFTKDDIGRGYDIVFASDVTISGILGKVYNALTDDGVLIYRRWTLNEDKTAPLASVLFDLMMAIMKSGHYVSTVKEYVNTLEEAGFSVKHIIDIATPSDPAKVLVVRKGV